MRLVLDTNVIVAAVLSDGPPREVLARCVRGDATLLVSQATMDELVAVLRRPKFGLGEADVVRIVASIAAVADVIVPTSHLHVVRDDPDDDRFLELAVDGGATAIVSGDRHLLSLGSYRGIPVVTPAGILAEGSWHP
ncbi:MAG TPA: putative toxin-antitoxin system toxin component, PIN family [Candidatus Thermoplasmatota archaeon]|nr:putative toxin-antitoxin system toxin component, PIN family [Candidatus Thermoplasmatota archaeon]